MIIGYARVSTTDQKLSRQLDQLKAAGCERIYEEMISGKTKDRPELQRMLEALRAGDVVVTAELTRLGRSVKDLFEIVDSIHSSGAEVKSLKEPWLDTTTPHGRLLFTFFAGISQFERELIRERTEEGLAAARARGRKGGHPTLDAGKVQLALKMYDANCAIAEILSATGISKSALYKYIKQRNNESHNNINR